MKKFKIIFLLFSAVLAGCGSKGGKAGSGETPDGMIIRFDRDVAALDKVHPDVKGMREKYGHYFDVYASGILQLGRVDAPDFPGLFSLFLSDSLMCEITDSVLLKYRDMSTQETELKGAFGLYEKYFPGRVIPRVYTHVSGFNQSVVVDSAFVGVGLDNYLGENSMFYKMLATPIPVYMRKKMTEREIVRDVVYGWLTTEFPYRPVNNDLISGMIYQGKVVFLLKKLLPDYAEERLFSFLPEQLKWCRENEMQMWDFLIANEYLFDTGQMLLRKYLFDAPFSSGMPTESPGKAVVWNGYQIVCKYMDRKGGSLKSLVEEQDYHKILREAAYRP